MDILASNLLCVKHKIKKEKTIKLYYLSTGYKTRRRKEDITVKEGMGAINKKTSNKTIITPKQKLEDYYVAKFKKK
jgi:hypothetical protein